MGLLGIIQFSITKHVQTKANIFSVNEETSIFGCLKRETKEIDEILKQLMAKVNFDNEKIHLNLLLNKNKS